MAAQTATAFYPRLLVCVSTFLYARYVPAVAIYCEITLQASENNYKSAKLCVTFDVMCAQLISRRLQRYKSATATSALS